MKYRATLLAAGLALLALSQAMAQVTITDSSTLVGINPAPCVPAGQKSTLILKNQSAYIITYCFGSGCTPVAAVNGSAPGGTGSYDIAPGGWVYWPPGSAPRNALSCVAGGANSPLAVGIGN